MALPDLLGAVRRVLFPTTAQEVQALLQQAFGQDAVSTGRLASALAPLEATGRLEDAAALTVLLEAGDLPPVWQTLDRRGPVLALAAWRYVFAHAGQPGHSLAVARGLFQRAVLAAPEAVALLPESARPAALALRDSLGADLPPAAWASPWDAAPQARRPRRRPAPEPVPWPERFHHQADPEPAVAPAEDERLLALFRRSASLWPLLRMTDDAALRCWLELDAEQVQVIGPELERLIPRLGLAGVETSLRLARLHRTALPGLRDLESPRVAPLLAPHLSGPPAPRALARGWLARFPEAAAVGLAPSALGAEARARAAACEALRWLLRQHGEAARRGLARYPHRVRDQVEAALAQDAPLPRRRPRLPSWVDPARLPPPLPAAGGASVQGPALLELVQLLAATPLQGGPWLDRLRREFQPEPLEALAWALFHTWLGHGAPSKERWALHALAHFPSPAAVEGLAGLAAELAPRGKSARAQQMVEVLAAMGTRESLLAVRRLGRLVTARAFRARTELVFQAAAEAQGLSAAELGERLTPDLGLTPEGWLPGGAWRLVVLPDLRVRVEARAAPTPPPSAEAPAHLAALGAEAGRLLQEGAARLEARMLAGESLGVEHFTETYLMHPLLVPLAAGVMWSLQEPGGAVTAFTVGAHGPEDLAGRPVELPADARVAVVHPASLAAEERRAWLGRLPLQPFVQLRRHRKPIRSPAELAVRLGALQGREAASASLLRLQARGWSAPDGLAGGLVRRLQRRVDPHGLVEVLLEPGLDLADPRRLPVQRVQAVSLSLRSETPSTSLDAVERELFQVLRDR